MSRYFDVQLLLLRVQEAAVSKQLPHSTYEVVDVNDGVENGDDNVVATRIKTVIILHSVIIHFLETVDQL